MSWTLNKILLQTTTNNIPILPSLNGDYFRLFFCTSNKHISPPINFKSLSTDVSLTLQCSTDSNSEIIVIIFVATANAVGEQTLVAQGWCLIPWKEIFAQHGLIVTKSTYIYEDSIPYTLTIHGSVVARETSALVSVREYMKTESEYLKQWNEDNLGYMPFHSTLLPAKFPYYMESSITMPGYMYPRLVSDNPFHESVLENYCKIAVKMIGAFDWQELLTADTRAILTVAFRASQIYVTSCSYTQDVVRIEDNNLHSYFSGLYVSWQRSPHILLRMAEAMNSVTYDHSGDCEEFARATCFFWNALRSYEGRNKQLVAIKDAAKNYREYIALSAFVEKIHGSHMTCVFLRNDLVPDLHADYDSSLDRFVWLDSVTMVPIFNGGNSFDKYDKQRSRITVALEDFFSSLVTDGDHFKPAKKITHWLHTELTSESVEFSKICIARLFPIQPHNQDVMLLPVNHATNKFGVMVSNQTSMDNCIPIRRYNDTDRDRVLERFHLMPRKLISTTLKEELLWTIYVSQLQESRGITNIMINSFFYNKLNIEDELRKKIDMLKTLNIFSIQLIKFVMESTEGIPPVFLLQIYFN